MQESLGREDQQMPRSYPAEFRRQVGSEPPFARIEFREGEIPFAARIG